MVQIERRIEELKRKSAVNRKDFVACVAKIPEQYGINKGMNFNYRTLIKIEKQGIKIWLNPTLRKRRNPIIIPLTTCCWALIILHV